MTTCQACGAPSDTWLCLRCTTELRDALTELAQGPFVLAVGGKTKSGGKWHIERRTPGLLANLADVTNRQTRIGSGGGHRKRGDEMVGLYEPDTENGRATKQGNASDLTDAVTNGLSTIIRDLCESRGLGAPLVRGGEQMATWLATNVHAIALDESAGVWLAEITGYVRRIERVIDRPEPPRFIGPCPAAHPKDDRKRCNTGLAIRPGAIEVTCPTCKTTHNAERVKTQNLNEVEPMRFTRSELLMVLSGHDENLPKQTLHDWIKAGKLKPQGWKRPDGRIGATRHSDADKPVYRLADVRRLRNEQPVRKAKAG